MGGWFLHKIYERQKSKLFEYMCSVVHHSLALSRPPNIASAPGSLCMCRTSHGCNAMGAYYVTQIEMCKTAKLCPSNGCILMHMNLQVCIALAAVQLAMIW